jgi:hypothetical protein
MKNGIFFFIKLRLRKIRKNKIKDTNLINTEGNADPGIRFTLNARHIAKNVNKEDMLANVFF